MEGDHAATQVIFDGWTWVTVVPREDPLSFNSGR